MSRFTSAPATVASAFLLAVLVIATPSSAQDAQQQAMGRTLFNEGLQLFNDGKYEAACSKLEASLKQYAGLGTRGKLAECYEKLGRFASAWQQYREVALLATRSGDATREQVASERAKALETKLSYVTVTVPRGHDVPGLVIKRNGREVEKSKLGSAEPVDAGIIVFEISAPGRKPSSAQITVTPGQAANFEVPALESLSSPAVSAPPMVEPPPPPPPPEPLVVRSDPPEWQKPTGIVLMAAGALGVGIGSAFGLSASSSYDAAFEGGGCDRATKTCDAAGQDAVDDARSKATLSTILFTTGALLAAGGVVLYLTAPSAKPTGGLRIMPAGYAGGGGLVLSGGL